jgi:two-component system, chemotaxis family, chemotaxis protein CheY
MHILIVDDQPTNRRLPAAILGKLGCRVAEAENGEQALDYLAREAVDCVLLDISMPGLTGDEVCRRIRQDARLQGLRVVAYTAHAMYGEEVRIMDAGFDAILIKPISRVVLLQALGLAG